MITMKITDAAGNEAIATSYVSVNLLSFLQDVSDSTPPDSSVVEEEEISETTQVSASELVTFGGIPTITAIGEYATTDVSVANTTIPFTNIPLDPNILWGAAATAMVGATLADWARKREEEERRRAEEQRLREESGGNQNIAARRMGLKAAEQAVRDRWTEQKNSGVGGKAQPALQKVEPPMPKGLSPEAQAAYLHGGAAASSWIGSNAGALKAQYAADLARQKEKEEDKAAEEKKASSSKVLAIPASDNNPPSWWDSFWNNRTTRIKTVTTTTLIVSSLIFPPILGVYAGFYMLYNTPPINLFGVGPDYNGINIALENRANIELITDSYNLKIKNGEIDRRVVIDPIMIEAAFAVQNQWNIRLPWIGMDADSLIAKLKPNSSTGLAQLTAKDLKNENLQLLVPIGTKIEPSNPYVATAGMIERIAPVVELCAKKGCSPIDQLIAASMAQNGNGFTEERLREVLNNYEVNGQINWEEFYEQQGPKVSSPDSELIDKLLYSGYNLKAVPGNFDTEFMTQRYVNNLRELHDQGVPLPEGVNMEDLDYAVCLVNNLNDSPKLVSCPRP